MHLRKRVERVKTTQTCKDWLPQKNDHDIIRIGNR